MASIPFFGIDAQRFSVPLHPKRNPGKPSRKPRTFKKIILFAAAYPFSSRKGFDDIVKLSKRLDYERFELVVAGLRDDQASLLDPRSKTAGIVRDSEKMHRLFSAADYFLNPTYQDNFPTVNIESLASGTPVITYDTGGSAEMLSPETGYVVKKGDFDSLMRLIDELDKTSSGERDSCYQQASIFTDQKMGEKYYELFASLLSRNKPN